MRIVFCGSPPEAAESLRVLAEAGHEVAAVVTRPNRPRGRGLRAESPPVRLEAERLGATCLQPEDINDPAFLPLLEGVKPDLLVVVAFGAILKPRLLELAPRGAVNWHRPAAQPPARRSSVQIVCGGPSSPPPPSLPQPIASGATIANASCLRIAAPLFARNEQH